MKSMDLPFTPYQFPAVVEPIANDGPLNALRVRLYYNGGWLDALTWALDVSDATTTVSLALVTVVELPAKPARYLLMHCQPDSAISGFALLPDSLCPLPGVISQIKPLVAGIACEPLRRMVTHALLRPDALSGFWRAPASLNDHHSYPGGLARHSLEVATMVTTASLLSQEDRDLGVAMALLHDYGKIWCYRDGKYRAEQKRGHEVVGLEKLAGHLDILRRESPDVGAKMYELLSGLCHRKERRYPLAIGRIVHAFDQMSCEMTRRVVVDDLEDVPF